MIGVVKIGGAEGNRPGPLMNELSRRVSSGERWVLVHGASGIMDRICAERGVEVRMIISPSGYRSRFVGERERDIFEEAAMTYGAGIKELLGALGTSAEQIDPKERRSVLAKRKDVLREGVNGRIRIVRGNYSGRVSNVAGSGISEILAQGSVPIMPPLGFDDESGLNINIDGDRLAAAVAAELGADSMIILSNVPGLMRDIEDPQSIVKSGALSDWEAVERYAEGNMKRKLVACKEALELGVPKVFLADGRAENPIENAMRGNATCLIR